MIVCIHFKIKYKFLRFGIGKLFFLDSVTLFNQLDYFIHINLP